MAACGCPWLPVVACDCLTYEVAGGILSLLERKVGDLGLRLLGMGSRWWLRVAACGVRGNG